MRKHHSIRYAWLWAVAFVASIARCDSEAVCVGSACASDPEAKDSVGVVDTTSAEVPVSTPASAAPTSVPTATPNFTPVREAVAEPLESRKEEVPDSSREEPPAPSTITIGDRTFVPHPDPGYSVIYRDYGQAAPPGATEVGPAAVPPASPGPPVVEAPVDNGAAGDANDGTTYPVLDGIVYIAPGRGAPRRGQSPPSAPAPNVVRAPSQPHHR